MKVVEQLWKAIAERRGTVSLWELMRRRLPFEPKTIRKHYKNGFFVDLVDYYESLWRNGWYEHSEIETQNWIIDHVERDWVIFDVGAHIGYYSMLLCSRAPQGRVYSFEASEETCEKFKRNIEYNVNKHRRNFGNIELIQIAVGDRVTHELEETLYFSGKPDNGKVTGRFNFMTLDYFCESRNIKRVDLIKSDVDSWDYEVLLGAREIINRFRPLMIAEVNYALRWRNHSEDDVKRLLDTMNYGYQVLDYASPTNWLMFPKESGGRKSICEGLYC